MSPLSVVIIVGVALLVVWRVIRSYSSGGDNTRGGDGGDGYSPIYSSASDGGYDHDIHRHHSHDGGSHGESGGWDTGGDSAGGGDSGAGDGGGGSDGGSSGGSD